MKPRRTGKKPAAFRLQISVRRFSFGLGSKFILFVLVFNFFMICLGNLGAALTCYVLQIIIEVKKVLEFLVKIMAALVWRDYRFIEFF